MNLPREYLIKDIKCEKQKNLETVGSSKVVTSILAT